MEIQVKYIQTQYLLKHIMQEIILATVLGKTGADTYLSSIVANEPHDISCHNTVTVKLKDFFLSNLIPVCFEILGEY